MKVYEAIFTDGLTDGIFGISLVEDPAMQDEWITLSEQPKEVQFEAIDEAKQLLLGAVLIPDKKIYRNIDGNEFYITFSAETIGKLAHNFISRGHQNSSSIEHETKVDSVSFVESWQVDDPKIDKSALYGKEYEKGTWVTMAHVADKELYESAKRGELKGFSIDAMLQLDEVKFNNNKMKRSEFLSELKSIFTFDSEEKIEVQEEVQEEQVEVKEEVTQEVTEEPQLTVADVKEAINEVLTQFKTEYDGKLEAIETKLSKEVEEKEAKVAELEVELDKQPEVEAIKAKPEVEVETKPSQAMGIRERVKENLKNVWN